MLHEATTGKILGCFYKVYNTLGFGFLENVYEKSLCIELQNRGMTYKRQCPIDVYYDSTKVGNYYADIIVDDTIILELKASKKLLQAHEYQLINYLKATDINVGLLLNFGKEPTFKRKIYT
jgi:GxxExxY protein